MLYEVITVAIVVITIAVYFLREKFGIQGIETIGDRFNIDPSIPKPTNVITSYSIHYTKLYDT